MSTMHLCLGTNAVTLWLLLAVTVTLSIAQVDHTLLIQQDLSETFCPVCNMVVQPKPNQLLRGSQVLYACKMAGHLKQLVSNPKSFVREISAISTLPAPYANSTVACPVCHDSSITHAVHLGPHGNQMIFACSEHHASTISTNPADVFIYSPSNDTSAYCQGATTMYDGFQSAFHGICPRLLFPRWVLNSEVKYGVGFLGIVLMGMLLEWWVEFQDRLQRRFVSSVGLPMSEATARDEKLYDVENSTLEDKLLPVEQRPLRRRSLPLRAKAVLATSYTGMMALAYFLMLVVMSYESGFFIAALLGVGLGFFFFRDVDTANPSSNPDPCCST
ncbi:hypothetical protein H310_00935 [Aphanomyces invadans]|uniref:Copper transport protein n=1 Tax=Aphanomyces invadans TaxID=157072 RepID=A0A024UQ45_9STRA|nr:hypothetical protein H310_00935 [Aphanomyces invadans]ETW08325.1 hypothetical protein H310_00935 [Aphanomyces invadans]|eukprot:XP_008862130.1 hypothetical protein H310_00935 [Aphanomyces invadans]